MDKQERRNTSSVRSRIQKGKGRIILRGRPRAKNCWRESREGGARKRGDVEEGGNFP